MNTYDLKTKVERAIAQMIVTNGAGTWLNTFPGEATGDTGHELPNTVIDAGIGDEDDFTGNYRFFGKIIFTDMALNQPTVNDTLESFSAAQQRVSTIIGLFVQTDDQTTMDYSRKLINGAANSMAFDFSNGQDPVQEEFAEDNSDMTDFALTFWRIIGYGRPVKKESVDGGLYYERVVEFECQAANSQVGDVAQYTQIPVQVSNGGLQVTLAGTSAVQWPFLDSGTDEIVWFGIVNGEIVILPNGVAGITLSPISKWSLVDMVTNQTVYLSILNNEVQVTNV